MSKTGNLWIDTKDQILANYDDEVITEEEAIAELKRLGLDEQDARDELLMT